MKTRTRYSAAWTAVVATVLYLVDPTALRADMFGGDVVVLGQILANALQQLEQLRQIVGAGEDSLSLMRDINRGINDSLHLVQTISPNRDPGLYKGWLRAQDALAGLQQIYGAVVPSNNERVQRDTDQNVAEAVALNNSLYTYTRQIDDVGQEIESASHSTSPGGAQKLTAESLGVIIHVLNASLRAQATGLKLHAQELAIQNRKDKEETKFTLDASDNLSNSMKNQDTSFQLPRF